MNADRFRVLNLRRLRENRFRTAVSILGIAAGVALVVAMGSMLTSVTATAKSTVRLLGGAKYEIVSGGGVTDDVRSAVASAPGVAGVRRFVEVPVLVDGEQGWLVALDRDSSPLSSSVRLSNGDARALAATRGLHVGSAFPAMTTHQITGLGGVTIAIASAGRVDGKLASRYNGRFVAADIETAIRLRGVPGADSLLVYGKPDPKAVADSVEGRGVVRATADRVTRAKNTIQILFSSLSILGAMGLIVGGFLMFNTMNMAVMDRRSEIASLRALGSDRRSIWRSVLLEAALLGILGSALGVLLGAVMARGVIASIPDAAMRSLSMPLQTSVERGPMAVVAFLGVLTALVASISPARRTLDVEPIEALRPDLTPTSNQRLSIRWVPLLGGLVLAGLAASLDNQTMAPELALGAAVIALLAIVFGCGRLITGAVGVIASRLGANGQLAALSLERAPRRVWSTTATVIVSIAVAFASTGLSSNVRTTATDDMKTVLKSDFWIGTTPGDSISLTGLPNAWANKIAAIPGVRAVPATRWIPTQLGAHIVGIDGVLGESSYPFTRLASEAARDAMANGSGVIVLRGFARVFHTKVGDVIDVPGAAPPLRLPIVAITDGVVPNSGGLISISHALFVKHFGIDTPSRYEVQLQPGADRAAVRRQLTALISTAGFPVQVYSGEEFYASLANAMNQLLALVAAVLLVIVACAGIAVLNTLLASVLERTREIAVLRAIGATKRQLVRSVMCEALAIGLTGGILGAIAGAGLHWVAIKRIADLTTLHIAYSFSLPTVLLSILSGVGVALVGASIPARRVARLDLLNALTQ